MPVIANFIVDLRSNGAIHSGLGFESFTSHAGGLGAKWHALYPELRRVQQQAASASERTKQPERKETETKPTEGASIQNSR